MHVVFVKNQIVFYLVRPKFFLFMVSWTSVVKVMVTQSRTTHTHTHTHTHPLRYPPHVHFHSLKTKAQETVEMRLNISQMYKTQHLDLRFRPEYLLDIPYFILIEISDCLMHAITKSITVKSCPDKVSSVSISSPRWRPCFCVVIAALLLIGSAA